MTFFLAFFFAVNTLTNYLRSWFWAHWACDGDVASTRWLFGKKKSGMWCVMLSTSSQTETVGHLKVHIPTNALCYYSVVFFVKLKMFFMFFCFIQNRELQIMRKLDHCNIVRLRYFFYSSGDKVSGLNGLLLNHHLYLYVGCRGTVLPCFKFRGHLVNKVSYFWLKSNVSFENSTYKSTGGRGNTVKMTWSYKAWSITDYFTSTWRFFFFG